MKIYVFLRNRLTWYSCLSLFCCSFQLTLVYELAYFNFERFRDKLMWTRIKCNWVFNRYAKLFIFCLCSPTILFFPYAPFPWIKILIVPIFISKYKLLNYFVSTWGLKLLILILSLISLFVTSFYLHSLLLNYYFLLKNFSSV